MRQELLLARTYYLPAMVIGFDKELAFAPPRNGDIEQPLSAIIKAKEDLYSDCGVCRGFEPNHRLVRSLRPRPLRSLPRQLFDP